MKDILETYRTKDLKFMLKKNGISGYSKYNKNELIDFMLQPKYKNFFSNVKMNSNNFEQKKSIHKLQREANKFAKQNKKLINIEDDFIEPPKFTEEEINIMIEKHKFSVLNPVEKKELKQEIIIPTLIVDFD